MKPFPDERYGAIYADPPWQFRTWSDKGMGKSADNHYSTMCLADICALPVADATADDCVLFIWATMPQLQDAFRVIDAWGFKYKTCAFTWVKANRKSESLFTGMGYWTRSNAELCLLATRGKPKRLNADVQQALIAPIREHSRKPDEVRERIMRLVDGPYLEMFARERSEGWDAWGNETTKFSSLSEMTQDVGVFG